MGGTSGDLSGQGVGDGEALNLFEERAEGIVHALYSSVFVTVDVVAEEAEGEGAAVGGGGVAGEGADAADAAGLGLDLAFDFGETFLEGAIDAGDREAVAEGFGLGMGVHDGEEIGEHAGGDA